MSAIAQLGSTTVDAIRARFPRAAVSRIRGTGNFLLIFKCNAIWSFNAYHTAEERDEAWHRYEDQSCGALRCVHAHAAYNL
jgi:hypothetical protein